MIRFGLIGAGKHARRYAHHLRHDFPDLCLVAVARRDRDLVAAAAAEFGCRGCTDYRELIDADDIDAVIVVVPPTLHGEIVTRAAVAGKAILLEKPAAVSGHAGRDLLDTIRAHPVPVMVAQTLRYNGVVRACLAHREVIGAVHSMSFTQRFESPKLSWLDDPAISGGGMTLHTGVHMFDLARLFSGLEADEVTCRMEHVRTERTEDSFAATIRLGGGRVLAALSGSRAAGGRTGYIEVAGAQATFVGDHVRNHAHLMIGTEMRPLAIGAPVPTVYEVLRGFVDALGSGRPMPIPLEEGLRAAAIAEACYAAARSGAVEPVPRVE